MSGLMRNSCKYSVGRNNKSRDKRAQLPVTGLYWLAYALPLIFAKRLRGQLKLPMLLWTSLLLSSHSEIIAVGNTGKTDYFSYKTTTHLHIYINLIFDRRMLYIFVLGKWRKLITQAIVQVKCGHKFVFIYWWMYNVYSY